MPFLSSKHIGSFIAVVNLQTAGVKADLGGLGINATKLSSLAVSKVVHGAQSEVEAGTGVVDGENVDALAVVGELPAGAALLKHISECL